MQVKPQRWLRVTPQWTAPAGSRKHPTYGAPVQLRFSWLLRKCIEFGGFGWETTVLLHTPSGASVTRFTPLIAQFDAPQGQTETLVLLRLGVLTSVMMESLNECTKREDDMWC